MIMPRRFQISLRKSLLKHHQSLEASRRMKPPPSAPIRPKLGPDSAAPSQKYTYSVLNCGGYPAMTRVSINNWINRDRRRREMSTDSGEVVEQDKVVDLINIKFAEARDEIEMAMESKETVYFDEEAECARAAVKKVLDLFDGLLGKLPESGRAALQRSMGLKIEQLKAELKQLDD